MRMTKLGYWDKRYLRIKAQELENVANYESNLKPRLSSLEYELEQEANTWYSKYASNHDIDVDTAKQLLKAVGSTSWKMTLAEFRRKAIKGGYTKELESEYFKSRIARLQDLEEQLKEKAAGDEETMDVDEDFLLAMEHGMPPISGLGFGIDRFLQFIFDRPNIRDVVLFPLMK